MAAVLLIGAAAHPSIALPGSPISTAAKAGKVKCNHVHYPELRAFAEKVWDKSRWDRKPKGQPKPSTLIAWRAKLSCAGPGHRKAGKAFWREAKRAFYRHRERKLEERRLDALTPFGDWAIPGYIVMCESGGNFRALNPSGAGGAYQIMPGTWAAYGGLAFAPSAVVASEEAQHIIAGRIWADVGASAWVCG